MPSRHLAGATLPLAAVCAATVPLLGGCYLDSSVVGTPRTVVERALAFCGEKTEKAETGCVRQALVDGRVGVAALVAMIPGCRVGTACTVLYRTRDRQGLLASTAADYVADWRVTFDLKAARQPAAAADVPFTVQQV